MNIIPKKVTHYIYLLQEREFIRTKDDIYKLGRTKRSLLTRFEEYPKGSDLLIQRSCSDCQKMENKLKKIFKEKFKQRLEIGNEYFEGNCNKMMNIICRQIELDANKNVASEKRSG